MFNCSVLDDIMKIDDIISCNISGLISDKDKDSLLLGINDSGFADKCSRNWNYARTVLHDNSILFNVDGCINFRLGTKLYRVTISALGYGIEIGNCQTMRYKSKIKTYGRRTFKRYIEKISGI